MYQYIAKLCLIFACSGATTPGSADPQRSVSIATSKDRYLLGEPVVLEFTFRNLSHRDVKVPEEWPGPSESSVHFYISSDGVHFRRFRFSQFDALPIGQKTRLVKVGESWKPQVRLLYNRVPPGLAFEKPGKHWIKTGNKPSSSTNWHAESNTVCINIEEPKGADAEIWRQLNDPAFFAFFQDGEELTEQHKRLAMKLIDILETNPKSSYAPAIRHALAKPFSLRFRSSLSFEEASRFGNAMEITGFAPVEQDPRDKRLDVMRTESFEQQTTIGYVLQSLSEDSGVTLDSTPEVKATPIRMADSHITVRDCMRTLRLGAGRHWERRGNAYFLVPLQAGDDKCVGR